MLRLSLGGWIRGKRTSQTSHVIGDWAALNNISYCTISQSLKWESEDSMISRTPGAPVSVAIQVFPCFF